MNRAQVEQILIKRCGKQMVAADLNGTTYDGTNVDLNDPIGYAIRQCGGTVADVTTVTATDVAFISADDHDKFLDIAELRLLENILGNLDDVDITVGPVSEKLSQLSESIAKRVTRLQAKIEKEHGIGGATMEAGMITLDFADHREALE